MKLKLIMAAILTAAVIITGCDKGGSDDGGDKGGVKVVYIKTKTPAPAPMGRGEGNRIVDATPVELGEGFIYFTDVNGLIKRIVEIKATGATGSDQVDLTTLRSTGATITGVPTSVTNSYIFANIPATTKTALTTLAVTVNTTNISAVQALTMAVGDLKDANYGVANVPQWGAGNVGYNNTATAYETTINLEAMGSRLQIVKISTKTATGGEEITEYKVDGIFVNNFFTAMPVNYVHTAANITNSLSDISKYGGLTNVYTSGLAALADYDFTNKIGQYTTTVCTPVTGAVWAYNVWPTEHIASVTNATIPHLVIRLSNVKWNDGEGGADQTIVGPVFITVKGIISNGSALASIKKGHAYTFTNIAFSYDNLTTVPEETTIDAEVEINEIAWKEVEVDPDM